MPSAGIDEFEIYAPTGVPATTVPLLRMVGP
jgi:hypothetical protein